MAKPVPSQQFINTVWLEPEVGQDGEYIERSWYCPRCQRKVCDVSGETVAVVPGHSPLTPEVKYKCSGTIVYANINEVKRCFGLRDFEDFKRKSKEKILWNFGRCGSEYIFMSIVKTKNPEFKTR